MMVPVWICVFGIFFALFSNCASVIQSTNSQRWVKWRVKMRCADNPCAEIKYCRCAISQSGAGHVDGPILEALSAPSAASLCQEVVVAANTTANYCTAHKPGVVIPINNACLQATL